MKLSIGAIGLVVVCAAAALGLEQSELTEAETLAAEKRKSFLISYFEAELKEVEAAKLVAGKARDREAMKRLIARQKSTKAQLAAAQSKGLAEHHADLVNEIKTMEAAEAAKQTREAAEAVSKKQKWYEGGTLHNENGLAWQNATPANRLATCADFVAKAWETRQLNDTLMRNIKSMDDMRQYAQELKTCLDEAFASDPNPATNQRLYANQKASEAAALGMALMKWLK
jgi:hypothetical protein